MGRTRSFDEIQVLDAAAEVFRSRGYDGAGVDELLTATGLHRGSLYKAFGSKLGLFTAVLDRAIATGPTASTMDLLLVAALDLGPRDPAIRARIAVAIATHGIDAHALGERLLTRAHIPTPTNSLGGQA